MEKIELLQILLARADAVWADLQEIYPVLQKHDTPEILLNARFTKTAGRAWQGEHIIELGTKFLMHSPKFRAIMVNVILPHELAHIADFIVFGESEKKCGHGEKWGEMMVQCGLEPNPYHTMDLQA